MAAPGRARRCACQSRTATCSASASASASAGADREIERRAGWRCFKRSRSCFGAPDGRSGTWTHIRSISNALATGYSHKRGRTTRLRLNFQQQARQVLRQRVLLLLARLPTQGSRLPPRLQPPPLRRSQARSSSVCRRCHPLLRFVLRIIRTLAAPRPQSRPVPRLTQSPWRRRPRVWIAAFATKQ